MTRILQSRYYRYLYGSVALVLFAFFVPAIQLIEASKYTLELSLVLSLVPMFLFVKLGSIAERAEDSNVDKYWYSAILLMVMSAFASLVTFLGNYDFPPELSWIYHELAIPEFILIIGYYLVIVNLFGINIE